MSVVLFSKQCYFYVAFQNSVLFFVALNVPGPFWTELASAV